VAVRAASLRASANAADLCGDMAGIWETPDRVVLAIADGLGHGHDAAVAAAAAIDHVGRHLGQPFPELFAGLQCALAPTRGAAVGVAVLDPVAGQLRYAAVGNTRAAVFGWRVTRLDAVPGIVGAGGRPPAPLAVPCRPGDTVVLWTDGLDDRLSPGDEGGAPPAAEDLAADLLRRFAKGTDDSCVIVVRFDPG